MIYSLSGTIRTKQPNFVVLDVSGVGFGVKTTLNTTSKLGREGEQGFLYTHLNVREDALELYGFAQQSELECFLMLISISGVGPKAALTILSDRSPEEFALLVASEDVKALSKSSGIGPKTAQRIVLELKDKIGATQAAAQVQEGGEALPIQTGNKNAECTGGTGLFPVGSGRGNPQAGSRFAGGRDDSHWIKAAFQAVR